MTGGMMFKGTPGPWRFVEYQDAISEMSVCVIGANSEIVCDSEPYYPHPLDRKNGHLIAAAPELLMVLMQALQDADDNGDQMIGGWADNARAAIAKALGEQK